MKRLKLETTMTLAACGLAVLLGAVAWTAAWIVKMGPAYRM